MSYPGIAWPPTIGTHVWVEAGELLGKVVAVEGTAEDPRFTVAVLTPSPSRRTCDLSEFEPVSWPSARPTVTTGRPRPRSAGAGSEPDVQDREHEREEHDGPDSGPSS